ncbi:glycosyltransferase family 2 protein [Desulfosediminicola sp.]|uniref:glycosyltransferase family 2 protein n=1 Tax=Desulfosediminicola sp. TaxID=2886825 RepID=UPI003AF2A92D
MKPRIYSHLSEQHKDRPQAINITISILCPLYNEEEMVPVFLRRLVDLLEEIHKSFEVICINDGSTDKTLTALLVAKKEYPQLRIINLSRNFGKEAALSAGLDSSRGEVVIPIDADLQDPPELIKEMIEHWEAGYDVVLAKRVDRCTDSFLKRNTALLFYKIHNSISSTAIPENVGDYRLMSRKVVNTIKAMPENQRFMKGLFAWVGFKTAEVEYTRAARKSGKSKFNGWRLWNLALDGITSFSTLPIRIWLYLGIIISTLSLSYGFFIIFRTLILGVDVPGYASLLTSILFLGGIQLVGIGLIGEYIGRIYMESKARPLYIVEGEY